MRECLIMAKLLSSNLNSSASVPYFLWDEPLTVAELKRKLKSGSVEERNRAFGENFARGAGHGCFGSSLRRRKVWQNWDELEKYLGRRREFWKLLLEFWEKDKVFSGNLSKLNHLQNDFLQAFFARENRFFLSGGAALVGFYFGHRETHDLDLFTLENEIEDGSRLAGEVAKELNASVESIQTSPDFRRLLLKREREAIVIDLVREYVFQIEREKPVINGIRVDTPEEILANKLCALLSRSEIRDLVDVRELENAGFSLENALQTAARKDSGLTPAQLAWVLNQIKLGDDLQPPGNVSVSELRGYLSDLIDQI